MEFRLVETRYYFDEIWMPSYVYRLEWPEYEIFADQWGVGTHDIVSPWINFNILGMDVFVNFFVARSVYDYATQMHIQREVVHIMSDRIYRKVANHDTLVAIMWARELRLPIFVIPKEILRMIVETLPGNRTIDMTMD